MKAENWKQILSAAGCSITTATEWSSYFAKYADEYKINTPSRVAAFVANVMIESNHLRVLKENLNYSALGLARTWPKRYADASGKPNQKALSIAKNPQAIANHCYAGRMGNGPESSGDGWNYAGKGPIQITGRVNYENFFRSRGMLASTSPHLLLEKDLGTASAFWFWSTNGINAFADKNDFDGCCDKVNIGRKTIRVGDAHGFNARKAIYDKLKTFLTKHPELLEGKEVQVIPQKTMLDTIPPEITFYEQDPESEMVTEYVQDVTFI